MKQPFCRLASTFAELANTYYRDEGRRIKTRVEKKNTNSVELNIRYCFKVLASIFIGFKNGIACSFSLFVYHFYHTTLVN